MKIFKMIVRSLNSSKSQAYSLKMSFQFNMHSSGKIKPGSKWKWVLLFVGFPLLELWLILKLGSVMGWGVTLWLILMTGVIGGSLAHRQGFAIIQRIQMEMGQGRMPAGALLDGLFILVAGLVLITPGMITDLIGFCLLIPQIRRMVGARARRWLAQRFQMPQPTARPQDDLNNDDVIDV